MKNFMFFAIAILLLCGGMAACAQNAGTMTMTVKVNYKQPVSLGLGLRGAGTATIDWGDGKSDSYTLITANSDSATECTHHYAETSDFIYTITIAGKNVTSLLFDGDSSDNGGIITDLNVSKNTALTELMCFDNQLTNLDVSKNTALEKLSCGANLFTNLDISKNTALVSLECSGNHLTNLDISKNTALTDLYCSANRLVNLDISKNTALTYVDCSGNHLSKLDISKNTALTDLDCVDNQFSATALDKLFSALPDNTTNPSTCTIRISGNPGTDSCTIGIAEGKDWIVMTKDDTDN